MVMDAYPFPNVDTSDAQYARMFGYMRLSGVADVPGGGGLQVSQGGGLNVNVAAGAAWVRGLFARLATEDAPEVLAVTTPAASSRIDRVVARLDPTAKTVTLMIVDGTPGSGVAAALEATETGLYDVPLARFTVAPGASTPGTITDERVFSGSDVPAYSDATRPAAGRAGRIHYNTTQSRFEWWDGGQYLPLVDVEAFELTASQITDPQNLDVGKVNGHRFTSSPTAPASPAVGDVWVPWPWAV